MALRCDEFRDRLLRHGIPVHVVTQAADGFVVILEVVHTYSKRVGPPVARTAYQDHSPEQIKPREVGLPVRERGTGRPTKRERRQLEALRGYIKDR